MALFNLHVNGERHEVDVLPDTPLLWVLRDRLELTGAKYGCGEGFCGACLVHLNGAAVASCILPVRGVGSAEIVTIEGLHPAGLHATQLAWVRERVPQCGYCQAGQIMRAAALLATNPSPTDEEIRDRMRANICRCGTYNRIARAVRTAASILQDGER